MGIREMVPAFRVGGCILILLLFWGTPPLFPQQPATKDEIEKIIDQLEDDRFDPTTFDSEKYRHSYALWLGVSQARVGEYTKAAAAFALAAKAKPTLEPVATLCMANLFLLRGQYDAAQKCYAKALEGGVKNARTGIFLAKVMQRLEADPVRDCGESWAKSESSKKPLIFWSIVSGKAAAFEEFRKGVSVEMMKADCGMLLLIECGIYKFCHVSSAAGSFSEDLNDRAATDFLKRTTLLRFGTSGEGRLSQDQKGRTLSKAVIDLDEVIGWGLSL